MQDLYEDPDFALKLINKTKIITKSIGDALIKTGVHGLVIKDSVASSTIISPEFYRKFVLPSEKETIAHFKNRVPVIHHICTDSSPILKEMASAGADVLEIDYPVDLAWAKKTVGNKVVLKGNINAVEVLERGNKEIIEKTVKQCMNSAKKNGKYIISTGDSVPRDTPIKNIKMFVKLSKKYGAY
jgi:MtaA/CmuA family methyltransferase